jgi:hypothetical protein
VRGKDLAATIVDNNEKAISGSTITIIFDHVPFGTYQVRRRVVAGAGFFAVSADIPEAAAARLITLMKVGGNIQFSIGPATYSASLQGAPRAMQDLDACIVEANHLNSVRSTQ